MTGQSAYDLLDSELVTHSFRSGIPSRKLTIQITASTVMRKKYLRLAAEFILGIPLTFFS